MAAATYIGLIRAIGPVTHARMPMAALREACTEAGFSDVTTVLATGNVLFRAEGGRAAVLRKLQGVVNGFGLDNAVILRTPAELARVVANNPYPDAAADRPSALAVFFLAGPPKDAGWLADHPGPERLSISGLDLYADYPAAISTTKLPPARIEKRLGVVTTFRNWNTLVRLLQSAGKLAGRH